MMRNWLFVLLLAIPMGISGCTQGDDTDDEDFQGSCPSWVEGRSSHGYSNIGPFTNNATSVMKNDTFGAGLLDNDGRPLDFVAISFYAEQRGGEGEPEPKYIFVRDGRLTARFTREDTGEPLRAYDPADGAGPENPGQTEWTFEPRDEPYTDFEWHVDLAQPDEEPNPGPIRIDWFWQKNLDGNPNTSSDALISYNVKFWYRVCGS